MASNIKKNENKKSEKGRMGIAATEPCVLGIHDVLRILRIAHDLSAQELASRLEVSPSYVSQIEHGHRMPNMDLLKKYSETFKVPVSAILKAEETHRKEAKFDERFSSKMFRVMETIEKWAGMT